MTEFRGFSPKTRDTFKCLLADRIMVRGADWRYPSLIAFNHLLKPFADSQPCQALTFSVGGRRGSEFLTCHDGVKTSGGIALSHRSFAATKVLLHIGGHLAGIWPAVPHPSDNCT